MIHLQLDQVEIRKLKWLMYLKLEASLKLLHFTIFRCKIGYIKFKWESWIWNRDRLGVTRHTNTFSYFKNLMSWNFAMLKFCHSCLILNHVGGRPSPRSWNECHAVLCCWAAWQMHICSRQALQADKPEYRDHSCRSKI